MEDSSMFLQWALSTLQHGDPPPATPAPAYDDDGGHTFSSSLTELLYSSSLSSSMVPGEPPAREGHRATSSWSSGDTDSGGGGRNASVTAAVEIDGWSPSQNTVRYSAAAPPRCRTNQPVSWNFSSATARPSKEATPNSAAASRATDDAGGSVPQRVQEPPLPTRITAKGSGSSAPPFHIIAERKRREKINKRFIELSTVIPGLKKMDKATILSDATRYVKELQEKLKVHEDGCCNGHRKVPRKKPCITVPDDEDRRSPTSYVAAMPTAATSCRDTLPEIQVRISEGNVMVRIHCEDVKGVLVRLLAEVENLDLSIVHANAMPFSASTLIVNITAKVEEGFNNTMADDIVEQLSRALNQHIRNSKVEQEADV